MLRQATGWALSTVTRFGRAFLRSPVPNERARIASCGLLLFLAVAGCEQGEFSVQRVTGGDPEQGKALVGVYGCPSCHTIPGIDRRRGIVGPPLSRFAKRTFIAGRIPNQPANLVRWIENPPRMVPETGMPEMQIGETEARHIAAFLYTLH